MSFSSGLAFFISASLSRAGHWLLKLNLSRPLVAYLPLGTMSAWSLFSALVPVGHEAKGSIGDFVVLECLLVSS